MSQEKLAAALGLTFQQVQKYERGANRISSSRLHQLSRIVDVPISFFFDDMPAEVSGAGFAEGGQQDYDHEKLSRRETLELVRAYYQIEDAEIRKRMFELVKAIAGERYPNRV